MKVILSSFIVLISFCFILNGGISKDWIGKQAPEFSLKTLEGDTLVSLRKYRGSVVVIDFWATWCAPCKRSLPALEYLESLYPNKIKILAINIDDSKRNALDFLEKYKLNLTTLYDAKKEVVTKYDVPGMPSAVIIDKNGIIQFLHLGYTEDQLKELRKNIEKLL
jgi:thiol-disulfide isomerase/thioredoxin